MGTSDLEACRFSRVWVYYDTLKDQGLGEIKVHEFIPKSLNDFVMEITEPTKKTLYMKAGNSRSVDLPSNIVKAEITVCGREKISLT